MTMHYYCSRGISGVLEIGFRNPQPKINSNAREFIKEARQSAFEKTRFQFLAKPKGQVQVCRSEGQEHRNPTAESRARMAGHPSGQGQDATGNRNQQCPQGLPLTLQEGTGMREKPTALAARDPSPPCRLELVE